MAQQEPELDPLRHAEVNRPSCRRGGRGLLQIATAAWFVWLDLVPTAAAQEPTPAPAPAAPADPGPLLSQLRKSDLPLADARLAAAGLRRHGTVVRLQASDLLRDRFLARMQLHDKELERLGRAAERAAAAVQKQRLGKDGAQRVESLRSTALGVSRRQDLSKDRIVRELDPIVAELQELLLPTLEQVLAVEPDVGPGLDRLRAVRTELAEWHALYAAMLDGFDLHPDVQKHLEKNPVPDPPPVPEALATTAVEWLLLGLPLSPRDRRTVQENAQLRAAMDPEEFAGTQALNKLRYLLGLPMVRIDPKLGDAARDHSDDMARLSFFDHNSPVPGKRSFADRASRFGTSASSENIATGHADGEDAIRGWWYSPGHHRNMLGNHVRTGLGRSGTLWTQLFGG